MTSQDVLQQLIELLRHIQESMGVIDPDEITPETKPIGGLQQFDSLLGVYVTLEISELFNLPDDKELDNLFVSKSGKIFTVSEIANIIKELVG